MTKWHELVAYSRRRRAEAPIQFGDDELARGSRPISISGLDQFDLTAHNLRMLALLGEDMTDREIAATPVISDETASIHVARIPGKLTVSNRARAALSAWVP